MHSGNFSLYLRAPLGTSVRYKLNIPGFSDYDVVEAIFDSKTDKGYHDFGVQAELKAYS
jgi:hypothetical protein